MINALVGFALRKRALILVLACVLTVAGIISFRNLPIEAYPDIADTCLASAPHPRTLEL